MQRFPVQFSFLLPGRWQLSAYSQVQHLWIFFCLKQQIKYFSMRKQIHLGRASSSASFQVRQGDQLSELLHYKPQIMIQARYELGLGKLQEEQADFRSLCANVIKTTHIWWENNTQRISESSTHRIREWFGLEETLQIIQLQAICQDIQPMASKTCSGRQRLQRLQRLGDGSWEIKLLFLSWPSDTQPHVCTAGHHAELFTEVIGTNHGKGPWTRCSGGGQAPSYLQSC